MAVRTLKRYHDEKTKRLIRASQLLNQLTKHANGELEMTISQIQAARVVINKEIPDVTRTEVSGPEGSPIPVGIQVSFRDPRSS